MALKPPTFLSADTSAEAQARFSRGRYGRQLPRHPQVVGADLGLVCNQRGRGGPFRTKALAVLLGPAGIGLLGAFRMILDLARNVAELRLTSSGVRQIAEASGSDAAMDAPLL